MKKTRFSLVLIAILGATIFVSCGGGKKAETPVEVVHDQYQCPMKCTEEVFDKPDTCKVCGMELEKITKG